MALTTTHALTVIEPRDEAKRGRGHPSFVPSPHHRQLVEALVAVGAPHEAICRELVRLGCACASRETLRKAFPEELAHGKERRILHYAMRMHSIAMSNGPGAFAALRFMLGVHGGPQWRMPRDDAEIPPTTEPGETVHIYMPSNRRDEPDTEDDAA